METSEPVVEVRVIREISRVCCDFFGPAWSNIDQLEIRRIREGRSNQNYYCALRNASSQSSRSQVFVRFYGSYFTEGTVTKKESRDREVLISYVVSEKKLGPKLLGLFDGGRIEEFIPSTISTKEQCESPSMFKILAKKLALIHYLNLPFARRFSLIDNLTSVLEQYSGNQALSEFRNGSKVNEYSEKLLAFDYESEIEFLKPLFDKIPSKLVFSHNDLNKSNILVRKNADESDSGAKIIVIDYEYSGYGYRWADMVTFFSEICFNHCKDKGSFNPQSYPISSRRNYFLTCYVTEVNAIHQAQGKEPIPKEIEVEKLNKEIDFGGMVANLIQLLWRLAHPKIIEMESLWMEAYYRLELYLALKEYFENNHSDY